MKFSFYSWLRCGWTELDSTLALRPITLRVNESPRAEAQLRICWGAPWRQGIFSESTSKQLAQKKGKLSRATMSVLTTNEDLSKNADLN